MCRQSRSARPSQRREGGKKNKTQNEWARKIKKKKQDDPLEPIRHYPKKVLLLLWRRSKTQFYCSPEEKDKYTNAACWSHGGGAHMLGWRVWGYMAWVLKLKPDFPALFIGLRLRLFSLIVKDDFNLYSFWVGPPSTHGRLSAPLSLTFTPHLFECLFLIHRGGLHQFLNSGWDKRQNKLCFYCFTIAMWSHEASKLPISAP